MLLEDHYSGENAPFEGDLTLWLRSLPAGASINKATISLESKTPPNPPIAGVFDGTITFKGDQSTPPGTTLVASPNSTPSFVEVNFHTRRTLASVTGTGADSTLQVDVGGNYVTIAQDGTFTVKDPLVIGFTQSESSVSLPSLTVSKFKLTTQKQSFSVNLTKVKISSLPTNINVRLGKLPTFWTRVGELATNDTSPDFSAVLNAFLAGAQPQNGFYAIPFIIHSDTLAWLNATVRIDYLIDQPVLPPHLSEATLSYGFNPLPDIDEKVTTITLPRGAVPMASNAQIRGEFQPTRVAQESAGVQPTIANVVVSPQTPLAQPLQSPVEIALTGIDLA